VKEFLADVATDIALLTGDGYGYDEEDDDQPLPSRADVKLVQSAPALIETPELQEFAKHHVCACPVANLQQLDVNRAIDALLAHKPIDDGTRQQSEASYFISKQVYQTQYSLNVRAGFLRVDNSWFIR